MKINNNGLENNMTFFCCPVCKNALTKNEKTYTCDKKHTYDIAKSGYVNLLLPNQMNTKLPGDNKLMVQARTNFLNKDYYKPLADKLCEVVERYCKDNAVVFDAGCGEGYYTSKVNEYLNGRAKIIGADISKNALAVAAKRSKSIEYAVGSLFHLPLLSESCDVLMTLFAPYCGEEFLRVLKSDGVMVLVIPSEKHLLGLKKAVYDDPYLNDVKSYDLDGFKLIEKVHIDDNIFLPCNEDIANLFTMTPYYYKTSVEDSKKISELNELSTEIGFEILVYGKSK